MEVEADRETMISSFFWMTWVLPDSKELEISPTTNGYLVSRFRGFVPILESKRDFSKLTTGFMDDPLALLTVGIGCKQQSRWYSTCFS